MRKYFCDKCGAEITGLLCGVVLDPNRRDVKAKQAALDLCGACMLDLSKFLNVNAEARAVKLEPERDDGHKTPSVPDWYSMADLMKYFDRSRGCVRGALSKLNPQPPVRRNRQYGKSAHWWHEYRLGPKELEAMREYLKREA